MAMNNTQCENNVLLVLKLTIITRILEFEAVEVVEAAVH